MKEYNKDTSEDYEDLVGYVSENSRKSTLSEFVGIEEEYLPEIKPKSVDPEFSEQWQTIYVNFKSIEDYKNFMILAGQRPVPRLKEFVYSSRKDDEGLMNFFGGD